jgi:hypothetical protein
MKNAIFLLIAVLVCSCAVSAVVFAEGGYIQTQLDAAAGAQGATFGQHKDPRAIVADVMKIALGTLGVLFTGFTVYGGFLITLSRGEEEKITKGKKILQYGVIGLFIIASATSLVLFIDRYMRASQEGSGSGGFHWTTDQDTSQFNNPDPLYEPPPLTQDAWKDMGLSED